MTTTEKRNEFQKIISTAHLHTGNRAIALALCELTETFYVDGIISREEYHETMKMI